MICTSDCMIYKAHGIGFEKFYIPKCHFKKRKSSEADKIGMHNSGGVTVYIPSEYERFAPETPGKDMVVKGSCCFDFDNTSEKTVSDSMKAFRKEFEFFTVLSVDNKLYGTGTSHIRIDAV